MSAIQGYPSKQKVILGSGITNNFVTVIPTDPNRAALETPRFLFRLTPAPLTAGASTGLANEDGDNLFWVEDTGTLARPGDMFRAEDGAAQYLEISIVKVETNRFLLAVNNGLLPTSGDTFYILRYATQRLDETGSQIVISVPGPTQFVLDGVDREVEEDTADPSNNKPFPVKPLGRLTQSAMIDSSILSIDEITGRPLITLTAYASEIEVINSTGSPLKLEIGAKAIYIPQDGLKRQAIAIVSGTNLVIKTAQALTVEGGIVAINLFY